MSQRTNLVTGLVEQFRGERACTHAGTIGLEDTIYFTYLIGSHTQTGTCTRTNRIGRSHEGIRAEIDVKHRTLCTFTQHGLACIQQAVDFMLAVHQLELFQIFDAFKPCFLQFAEVIVVIHLSQYLFVTGLGSGIFLFKIGQDISYTHTVTAYFVCIGRADALAGCPHFRIPLGCFVGGIQYTVGRQDEVRLLGDVQAFLQIMAGSLQCFCFRLEKSRIKHNTVTDDIYLVTLENSRRNGTEHVLLTLEFQCMSGIRSTLETCHHVISRS